MMDDELKVTFRKAELEERARRKRHLMKLIAAEIALDSEPMTLEERTVHAQALRQLNESNMIYYYETHRHGGYWKTLWKALWGVR